MRGYRLIGSSVCAKLLLWGVLASLLCTCASQKTVQYGPYSIGRDESWFPLDLGDDRSFNLTAFTTALIAEIAKEESVPLELIKISWSQLFELLDNGEVGGILNSLPPNVVSMNRYSFSDPLILLGPVLIVPMQSTAHSLGDMHGKIVAVNQFDESVLIAQTIPSSVIRLYQNMPTALDQLKAGAVDGVLMPVLEARSLVSHLYSSELKIVTEPLNDKGIRLLTLRDQNKPLLKRFNAGLKKLKSSGKYTQLLDTFQIE